MQREVHHLISVRTHTLARVQTFEPAHSIRQLMHVVFLICKCSKSDEVTSVFLELVLQVTTLEVSVMWS